MNDTKLYRYHNGTKEMLGTFVSRKEAVDFAIDDAQRLGEPLDAYWIDILSGEYGVTTDREYDYEIIGE